MQTEAQKRAKAAYNKKMVNKGLKFSPNELDLVEFLKTKDNQAGYIKDLIRDAMNAAIASGEYVPTEEVE